MGRHHICCSAPRGMFSIGHRGPDTQPPPESRPTRASQAIATVDGAETGLGQVTVT